MKKIYSLYVSSLNNNQHFSYMELAVAACSLYTVIGEEFRRLVEAFRAAFEHEDDMFLHHDRSALTERLQKADAERIRLFRHMRDFIKTYETCSDEAKLSTTSRPRSPTTCKAPPPDPLPSREGEPHPLRGCVKSENPAGITFL